MTRRPLEATAVALSFSLLAVLPVAARPAGPGRAPARVHVEPGLAAKLARSPGAAIVSWDRDRTDAAAVETHLARAGMSSFTFDNLSVTVACAATGSDLGTIASAPGAMSVYGDRSLTPTLNRSVRTLMRGRPDRVWTDLGLTGAGVGIAVMDTGVSGLHPDVASGSRLKQNVRVLLSHREALGPGGDPPPCQDVYSSDQLADTEGTSGHGTFMASVAGGDGSASKGRLKGVAPKADLVGITVVDTLYPKVKVQDGVEPSLLAALGGFSFVLSNNLEGPGPRVKAVLAGWVGDGLYDPWNPITLAIRDLNEFGIVTVMPVGNEGPAPSECVPESDGSACRFNPYAVGPYAVAVGATPGGSRVDLAAFSARGDPVERHYREESFRYEPTVVAPGSEVTAARRPGAAPLRDGDGPDDLVVRTAKENVHYQTLSGTSVAAAHVAGLVALMQEAAIRRSGGCYLTAEQIRQILRTTATVVPGAGRWEAGAGAVDAYAAVLEASRAPVIGSPDPWMCPPDR